MSDVGWPSIGAARAFSNGGGSSIPFAAGSPADPYTTAKTAAIAAAQRNNAALWFLGNAADLAGNVFSDNAGTVQAVVNDPIGYLKDRNGNLYPMSQATSGNKPTLLLGASGYYAMKFNGTSSFLSTPFTQFLGTVVAAAVVNGTVGTNRIFATNAEQVGFTPNRLNATETAVADYGFSQLVAGAYVASFNFIGASRNITAYVNGANAQTVAGSGAATGSKTVAAIGYRVPTSNEYSDQPIFLVCVSPFANLMPDVDRQAIEAFGAMLAGATYP